MRKSVSFLLALILFFTITGSASAKRSASQSADLVMKNGGVYTVDENQEWAEAVAIKKGEIIYVGDNDGVEDFIEKETKVINLDGKMVLPGFIDTHSHMYAMAENLFWFNLHAATSIEEYTQIIKKYYEDNPDLEQIRGTGWDHELLEQAVRSSGLSPREILDNIVSDLPIVVIDIGHHNIWVNSKALELAGIDKHTADPQGGVIERDPETGEPTGILREFTAISLLVNGLPEPYFTVEQCKAAILAFQEGLAAEGGITSVFVPLAGESPHENLLEAFEELDNEGKLTVRYEVALWADETKGITQIKRFEKLRSKYQGKLYNAKSIKIFADGGERDDLTWDQKVLEKTVAALDKKDFRVYVHAFGQGVTAALDAFENAAEQNGTRDARHTITHIFNPNQDEIQRIKELHVIPNAQPGSYWGTKVMKSYFDAGIPATSSSDFPVNIYPITGGIEAGMNITDFDGKPNGESASLDQMIRSYTINNAYLMFNEDKVGSIEVGKRADLVVLEKNLFDIPVEEIDETKILMTIFDGQEVFRHPAFGEDATASEFIVGKGQTVKFKLSGGNSPYKATSSDSKIARATISKNVLSIKGLHVGTATVTLKDAEKNSIKIKVKVKDLEIKFD